MLVPFLDRMRWLATPAYIAGRAAFGLTSLAVFTVLWSLAAAVLIGASIAALVFLGAAKGLALIAGVVVLAAVTWSLIRG